METVDLARLLLDLLVVICAAKLAAEGAERIGVPAVLGEIVAGVVVGPSVLALVELTGERGVSLAILAELGVLLLLVQVGMEMELAELGRVGKASMFVAVIGVVVPFVTGAAIGVALGWQTETAIFVGAALTATSVGITARVFGDLRALATTEARVVLGAAVADDVLGLIILTVVVKIVSGDSVTVGGVAWTVLIAVGFLVASGIVGVLLVPRLLDLVHRSSRSGPTLTIAALAVILGLAVLADVAQLAFIIGAFMAGLAIGRSEHHVRVAGDLNSVGGVLIPVFFVLIGVHADVAAMLHPAVLFDASVLLVIAIAGKFVAAYGATGTRSDRLLIGIGMIPRGEVGLIFASIGLAQGVLDDELYGALLLVVLMTTVVTPPLLRWRINSTGPDVVVVDDDITSEPAGGWITLRGGELVLDGRPARTELVRVALQAAALADEGRPGGELLTWFGDRRDLPIVWQTDHTTALLDVLRLGSPRAVRLLDVTGVLERGVPTIADALVRRRADPSELDPGRVLRFPTVDRLDQLLVGSGEGREDARTVVLGALVLDVLGIDAGGDELRALLRELAVTNPAEVEHLVSSARAVRSVAAELDGYDRAELLQLADQIGSHAQLHRAHLLALASSHGGDHRDRLEQLHDLLAGVLAHPELLGEEASTLAESRRRAAQSLTTEVSALARVATAPDSYVLAHEPDELARQASLVEPLPERGTVRAAVTPASAPDHWIVDVACRDRPGLLAHLAAALAAAGCDIAAARVATWPDGAAVDTFLVRSHVRPRARDLALRMESSIGGDLRLDTLADVSVVADNGAFPWHTVCTITGRDRPGSLAALAAAFAAAGTVVQSARIVTVNGQVVDRFAVTDRLGRQLDDAAIERIRGALAGGAARRSRFATRRRR